MQTTRDLLYLSALVHDTGRLYQLADSIHSSPDCSETKKDGGSPHHQTQRSCFYTKTFIKDYRKFFNQILSHNGGKTNDLDAFLELTTNYQSQDTPFKRILCQAREYATGRSSRNKYESSKDHRGLQEKAPSNYRLASVFDGLNYQKKGYSYTLPVTSNPFEDKNFFPEEKFSNLPDYRAVCLKFEKDLKCIVSDNLRIFAETLLNLLKKHTATVPAKDSILPDISLFDHLKTTAAIATCLHDHWKATGKEKIQSGDLPLLLIGGDFSGIQRFLYNIASKYAEKNLQGRSYYLELLANSAVQKILQQLDLYQANLLYADGGRFYLIAPNTKRVKDNIACLHNTINRCLLDTHGLELYLSLDFIEVDEIELANQKIQRCWSQLSEKLQQQKRQRHKEELSQQYSRFFDPSGIGGKQIGRASCRERV